MPSIACPACGTKFGLQPKHMGKTFACPKCGGKIGVRAEADAGVKKKERDPFQAALAGLEQSAEAAGPREMSSVEYGVMQQAERPMRPVGGNRMVMLAVVIGVLVVAVIGIVILLTSGNSVDPDPAKSKDQLAGTNTPRGIIPLTLPDKNGTTDSSKDSTTTKQTPGTNVDPTPSPTQTTGKPLVELHRWTQKEIEALGPVGKPIYTADTINLPRIPDTKVICSTEDLATSNKTVVPLDLLTLKTGPALQDWGRQSLAAWLWLIGTDFHGDTLTRLRIRDRQVDLFSLSTGKQFSTLDLKPYFASSTAFIIKTRVMPNDQVIVLAQRTPKFDQKVLMVNARTGQTESEATSPMWIGEEFTWDGRFQVDIGWQVELGPRVIVFEPGRGTIHREDALPTGPYGKMDRRKLSGTGVPQADWDSIEHLRVSPHGDLTAHLSFIKPNLELWIGQRESGRWLHKISLEGVTRYAHLLAWSPDQSRIARLRMEPHGQFVDIFDVKTGRVAHTFQAVFDKTIYAEFMWLTNRDLLYTQPNLSIGRLQTHLMRYRLEGSD